MSLFAFFISFLIVAQYVSGNHVPIIRSWRLRDDRTWQPPCSHGTYQHEAITSRSRQLLMMGTWLLGHMVAWNMLSNYSKRNKEYKKWHLVVFPYPHWITMHGQPHIRNLEVLVLMTMIRKDSVSLLRCISCVGLWYYLKDDQVVRLEIECKLWSRRDNRGYELAVMKVVNQPRLRAVMNQRYDTGCERW